ncbi:MAG: 16S rRNA (cytidine(1402)-2'-O)-methyltransferase [Henriciella sp.]|nr:16S rRNA (cytidine(1402)-2'-O)-methyltransferase [Henriciella sp.]
MSSKKTFSNAPEANDVNRGSSEPKSVIRAAQSLTSGLYIVSTPIGNLRDITLRAIDTLNAADEILAEDTRIARRLLDAHDIRAKVSPYHDHNGAKRRPELMQKLADGGVIALISDAGTPLVSDPGWKLARSALDEGHKVFPIPGASALLAGLVASGLPSDKFMFCGFLSAKTAARKKQAARLADIPATLVFYESGPRLAACLSDLAETLGPDREVAVARELTKLFEETRRDTLANLAAHYREHGHPKGEIVILIGPPGEVEVTEEAIDAALTAALETSSLKQAAADIAARLGITKRDVYQRGLAMKADRDG